MRAISILALVLVCEAGIAPAVAQSLPDTENGRFAWSPIPDGMLRLDTRSGVVSTCKASGQGWACYVVPDERAALDAEIGRLSTENERLRGHVTAQGKTDEALPKSDPLVPSMPRSADGERKIEIPLPSDRDVNRFMGFLEDAWRRLVEMAARIQKNTDGKI